MGRTIVHPRPSSSGAAIFYGVSSGNGRQALKVDSQSNQAAASVASPGVVSSPQISISTLESSSNSSFSEGSTPATSASSLSALVKGPSRVSTDSLLQSLPTTVSSRDFTAIMALAKDTTLLFTNAPYIQVVVGVVQQIIQIADDVQTYQDRCLELIHKVTLYAGVIFEALRSPQIRSGNCLDDLKSDLLYMSSILESIYKILQPLSIPTLSARFSRVVLREEIISRIEEQDRKLDTMITSFQAILRTKVVQPPEPAVKNSTPTSKSTRPFIRPRSKPQVMFGRKAEIDRLVDLALRPIPARVAILGTGGIGKTSVALSVLHDDQVAARFGDNRLFISCEAATCADHIIGDLAFSLHMAVDGVSCQLLDAVLEHLKLSPFLIVLDNFETPWDILDARSEVETLLQELTSLTTVTVLLTIRGSQHPAGIDWTDLLPPLQPVDMSSALEIFRTISRKMDDHAEKLIRAVDCVPLAVTLLANLAAVDGETTEALWHRWCDESVAMVERGNDRLTSLDCSIQLSLSSPRIRRGPGALKLLSLLSLLPDGMSSETFRSLERGIPGNTQIKKGISTLRQNALVYVDSAGSTRILSPIRLYMYSHHPPSSETRRFLQDYFLTLASQATATEDLVIRKRLCMESGNIEALLVDSLENPLGRPLEAAVDAVLAFCHHTYLCGLGSSRGVSLAVEKLKKLPVPSRVNQSAKAFQAPSKARSFRNRFGNVRFWKEPPKSLALPPQNDAPIDGEYTRMLSLRADCLGCWGQLLSRRFLFDEAEEKFYQAKELHCQTGDTSGHAYDLHNLGCLLSRRSSTFKDAEAKFAEAKALHKQIGDNVGTAYDLMGLGQLSVQQSRFTDARLQFSQALELSVECNDELGQASALNNLGKAELSCSAFRVAEGYFSRALELNVKMDDVVGRADSLAGIACSLLLRSRFAEAKQMIKEAIAIRAPAENPDRLHILGRVFVAEYKFQRAEQRAMHLHEWMDDESGRADDLNYLAVIDFYRNGLTEGALYCRLGDVRDSTDGSTLANVMAAYGMMYLQICDFETAESELVSALHLHKRLENLLGQAFDLHHLGCYHIRCLRFDLAIHHFHDALALHEQIENVQGQADDHNKLAEILLRQGLYQEALTVIVCRAMMLHTQIGDIGGQGDDMYIQACVFLEQSRLDEAEAAVRQALDLHTQADLGYRKALDLATLSSVHWEKYKIGMKSGDDERRALDAIKEAIKLFEPCDATEELRQCKVRLAAMLEYSPNHAGVNS
ncbi:hypothetical protein Hypma_005893 [Hypsizygus marmoreus]|uniref:TPR-like protein n=1 Tax=Hypsizygus marmoreus TaxID=39966 RepID=A0A369KBP8_HYPMA|nr:hypothetical protein Hypma_005893 [Hypsizygus marmoreus]